MVPDGIAHKIVVADHGSGFDEYAKPIFKIFSVYLAKRNTKAQVWDWQLQEKW
jgi:hypothetical protein